MSLSDNLRALRKQKGYSQEQLAERLNVSCLLYTSDAADD